MAQCAQAINDLAHTVEVGSPAVSQLQELAPVVVVAKQEVVVVLQLIDNTEGIKHQYKVRAALHGLKLVVEAAYAFLYKVDDVYYCQSDSMSSVIQELNRPCPNLQSLHDFMGHLGN